MLIIIKRGLAFSIFIKALIFGGWEKVDLDQHHRLNNPQLSD